MKKTIILALALLATAAGLSAQSVNRAKELTTKGFIDKKSVYRPEALDSLTKCDEYVMLISSFEGCGPCDWLRRSDVFDLYPVTPYYTDYLLGGDNATIPQTFGVTGFPTCVFFDRSGQIVAVTKGMANYYGKLDKIIKNKERLCEHTIDGVPADRMLEYYNHIYRANAAYVKGKMKGVRKYAAAAYDIAPTFYNRFLLYKYHSGMPGKKNAQLAGEYKASALENMTRTEEFVHKAIIAELREN